MSVCYAIVCANKNNRQTDYLTPAYCTLRVLIIGELSDRYSLLPALSHIPLLLMTELYICVCRICVTHVR